MTLIHFKIMRSILTTLVFSLVAGSLAFCAVFFWQKGRIDDHHDHLSAFDWFCEEFSIDDTQRTKIEALHLAYFPECEDHCVHYADTKKTLAEITADPGLDSYPEHILAVEELARLKKEADKSFIDFIYSVAAEMNDESAGRYLQRMKGWLGKSTEIVSE